MSAPGVELPRTAVDRDADLHGLAAAIGAGDIEVALVDRNTGAMRWVSDAWRARFGDAPTLSRHTGPSTSRSEMHLPPPGETMLRARSMRRPDGTEQLVGLSLTGYVRADGTEQVAVTVRDEPWSSLSVTDRLEVVSVLDGLEARLGSPGVMVSNDAEGDAIGVIDCRIDRFDLVRELVGSLEAERLLGAVQRRIRAEVRADDLVYRLPDERFVVVCIGVHPVEGPVAEAERLREQIATVAVADGSAAVTASIGVATSGPGLRGHAVLEAAEAAREIARARGRNRLHRHDEAPADPDDRFEFLAMRFDHALSTDRLHLDYHPVADLAAGRLLGAEATIGVRPGVGLSGSELFELSRHPVLGERVARVMAERIDLEAGEAGARAAELALYLPLTIEQLVAPGVRADLSMLLAAGRVQRLVLVVPERDVRRQRALAATTAAALAPGMRLGVAAASGTSLSPELLHELADPVVVVRSRALVNGDPSTLRDRLGDDLDVVVTGVDREEQAEPLRRLTDVAAMGRVVGRSNQRAELATWLASISERHRSD